MITRTMYVLAVPDLERSAAFYRDVLGFEVREIGDPGWRIFEKDVCRMPHHGRGMPGRHTGSRAG